LVLKFKKKKFLFGEDVIDTVNLKLSDLYTQCTLSKTVKLAGQQMEVTVSIQKAVRKEMVDVNNPRYEIERIPKAWRNADGSKLE